MYFIEFDLKINLIERIIFITLHHINNKINLITKNIEPIF